MYTIRETLEEVKNEALALKNSAIFYGGTLERAAFVWQAIAEKTGREFILNIVRFFDNQEWIDTWYPIDRDTACRLALDWANGSNEVKDRVAEALQ